MTGHCACGRFLDSAGICSPCLGREQMTLNARSIPSDPRYAVSEDGVVYGITGEPRKTQDHHGYRIVSLSRNSKTSLAFVHRLVLEAFVGPCPDGMEVMHLNGIRDDNRLSNLRYGTRKENVADTIRHGNQHMLRRDRCSAGHLFSPENTRIAYTTKNAKRTPYRLCKACKRDCQIRYRARVAERNTALENSRTNAGATSSRAVEEAPAEGVAPPQPSAGVLNTPEI